jgi:raffinose/stachyose/melibiose transport system permease protein
MKPKRQFHVGSFLFRIVLYVYAVISLYPLIWMLFYSFKDNQEIFVTNPFGFPTVLRFENYAKAWNAFNLPVYFMNSVKVTLTVIVFVLIFATMFAYATARMRFRGQHVLRLLTMIGLFLPLQCIMIPIAVLVRDLHINNTLWAVIVPYTAFNLSFAIMVLYGYMRSLPFELEESACIDGASLFTCFLRIIVPNVKTAMATVAIFVFMNVWNEYNLALILLTKDNLKTLPLGLLFFQGEYTTDWGAMGATMVIASIPTVLIYTLFSSQVEKAMTVSGAVKG